MRIFCWNVRGLRNPWAIYCLRNKLSVIRSQILFLMETKLSVRKMKAIRKKCGFACGIEVGANGSKGGLCLGWTNNDDVTLRSFSNHHVDLEIVKNDGAIK